MTRGNNHNVFSMAALDMSLDEIEHTNPNSNRGNDSGNRGRGRGRIRGRGRGDGRGRGTMQGRGRGRGSVRGRGRGRGFNPNSRSSRGGRGYGFRRSGTSSLRGQSMKRGSRAPPRGMGSIGGGRNPSNIETTGKVIVKNLGSHVTSDDVKEIFEKVGTITQAFVRFDKTGKSTGTAEVVYARKDDARKAQRDLDGAQVDGIPINVTLSSQSPTFFRNSAPQRGRGSHFSNRMNNNNMSRGRRPSGRGGSYRMNDNNNNNNIYCFHVQVNPLYRFNNK